MATQILMGNNCIWEKVWMTALHDEWIVSDRRFHRRVVFPESQTVEEVQKCFIFVSIWNQWKPLYQPGTSESLCINLEPVKAFVSIWNQWKPLYHTLWLSKCWCFTHSKSFKRHYGLYKMKRLPFLYKMEVFNIWKKYLDMCMSNLHHAYCHGD